MSAPSAKQQPSDRHHCRFCNHKLDSAKQRCPGCKRGQERVGEVIALALMVAILGLMLYLLVSEEDKFEGIYGDAELNHLEISYGEATETVPVASSFQPIRREPVQSSVRVTPSTQLRPPKAAPLINYKGTRFRQTEEDFPYYVAEKKWNATTKRYDFYRRARRGPKCRCAGRRGATSSPKTRRTILNRKVVAGRRPCSISISGIPSSGCWTSRSMS